MKELIKHLFKHNKDEIVKKSLLNCHVKGLHSIMLLDCPGKTIRLYISYVDSEMYRNDTIENISLSFHPHHCALTLLVVKGCIKNWIIEEVPDPLVAHNMFEANRYLYTSQITSGKGMRFELDKKSVFMKTTQSRKYYVGESVSMGASAIHTVWCPQNELVAWLVFEGEEATDYKPYSYSRSDLTTISSEGLYQPANETDIEILLHNCGLI